MRLIDAHCHLTDSRLAARAGKVLARAQAAGVVGVVSAATSVPDALAAAELARRHERVFWTAGVHPHEAKDAAPDHLERVAELVAMSRCVAVGEIGLDYHYDFSPRDLQRRVFAGLLALAKRLSRPVVVHTREAFDDTLAILAEAGVAGEKVVFHSFTGPPEQARRVLDLGAFIGFSGIVTFDRASDVRVSAALVPADRLLVETDSPYLSPEPVRAMKINEPANVVHVIQCLSTVRGITWEALAEQTTANATRFFSLDITLHTSVSPDCRRDVSERGRPEQ